MKTTTRIIPEGKIGGLRFGQLLINALCAEGHLEQIPLSEGDINEERYGITGMAYAVRGADLFYLSNKDLENILQNFLNK